MKWRTVVPIVLLALVLCVASACGGGGAAPTPTSTPTLTPTPTPTPTPEATEYPPPGEGKGNLAGHITWNGKSWQVEQGTRAGVQLFTRDGFDYLFGLFVQVGSPVKRGSADTDGYFLFKNIEPGYYYVRVYCPPGASYDWMVYGPVEVVANQTTSIGEIDPYDTCTGQ